MTIHPHSLRVMGQELLTMQKEAARGRRILEAAQGVVKRVKDLGGAKKKFVEGIGENLGEGIGKNLGEAGTDLGESAKRQFMTMGGSPNAEMRQFGRQMGEEAVEGGLSKVKELLPTKKTVGLVTGAGLGLGTLGAYGHHRAGKRRQRDLQQAVASGVRQGMYSPATTPVG